MCGSEAQLAFYSVDKCQASDRDRFGPAIIADRHAVLQTLFDPLAMRSLKVSQISKSAQLSQTLQVDDRVAFRRPLDLVESALLPLRRMAHDTGANHVQVDVDQASMQMFIRFDRCGMIAIFPERSVPPVLSF